MTKSEFLLFRQTRGWMYSHALTVTGNYVAGVHQMTNPSLNRRVISGKVIVNPDDCGGAPAVDWDLNGVAIDHDFGDLDIETVGR